MPPSAVPKTSTKQRKTQERIRKQAKPVYMHSDDDVDKWKVLWISVDRHMQNDDIVQPMLCIPVHDSRHFYKQYRYAVWTDGWTDKWRDELIDWLVNILNDKPIDWLEV